MPRNQALSRLRFRQAFALGAILAVLSASVAFAGNGNNGTVKVHEGATDSERIVREDSHVCTFHLHFFFADAFQEGTWRIDQAPPTGVAPSGVSGSYAADANGEAETLHYGLPIGHYDLSWQGRNDQNIKHKSFWVTCDNPPGEIGGGGGIG
jgi:hypothetical protein